MHLRILGVVILFQIHAIGSHSNIGISEGGGILIKNDHDTPAKCNCDISTKYIDIAQIDRSHIKDMSADQIIKKLHKTLQENYKIINDIMVKSKCNFSYVQRGLRNIQQTVFNVIEIFSCPEKRKDEDLFTAAFDIFVSAKDTMIGDMRSASRSLSQECADLFTKIRPAACNTGENIIFAVLNSLKK